MDNVKGNGSIHIETREDKRLEVALELAKAVTSLTQVLTDMEPTTNNIQLDNVNINANSKGSPAIEVGMGVSNFKSDKVRIDYEEGHGIKSETEPSTDSISFKLVDLLNASDKYKENPKKADLNETIPKHVVDTQETYLEDKELPKVTTKGRTLEAMFKAMLEVENSKRSGSSDTDTAYYYAMCYRKIDNDYSNRYGVLAESETAFYLGWGNSVSNAVARLTVDSVKHNDYRDQARWNELVNSIEKYYGDPICRAIL